MIAAILVTVGWSELATLAIVAAVNLSSETWTERQVMRARFPRKLVRKNKRTAADSLAHISHMTSVGK